MDPDDPDLNAELDPNDNSPHRLPRAVATLRHPDGVTVIELGVRGEFVVAHELSSIDASMITGCASVSLTGLPTELLALLVTTGYVAGRDALTATDALARGLPMRLLPEGARRACELFDVIADEVERQRRERAGEAEDGFDA